MEILSVERLELLLLVAAVVALVSRRLRIPYTVGLVIGGALLAIFVPHSDFPLTKDLVFRILLPPLIFEAALFTNLKSIKPVLKPVLALATAGVLISTLFVGVAMRFGTGWGWGAAMVFASLIAATDPVSVIAILKEQKVGGQLKTIVESESLLNDGMSAVLFSVALLGATQGQVTADMVFGSFIHEVAGGAFCGAVVAGIGLFLAGKTDDPLLELTFSTVVAFGAFLFAERFHASGVLAVLVAGILVGNFGGMQALTAPGVQALEAFWEFAAFLANSLIFLLIGLREYAMWSHLVQNLPVILFAILVTVISRAIGVYSVAAFFRRGPDAIPPAHQHLLFWGGLRGALSLALVLGLPETFPHRESLVAATFGVVAFNVIVQSLSVPPVLKKLGIVSAKPVVVSE
jgi:CPA1 family monovalent cation:H+ antiporter